MLNHLGAPGVPDLSAQSVPSDAVATTELEPLNNHVFVVPDKPVEKVGALFVPPTSSASMVGTVIASGSALVKPGDRVVFTGLRRWEQLSVVALILFALIGAAAFVGIIVHTFQRSRHANPQPRRRHRRHEPRRPDCGNR